MFDVWKKMNEESDASAEETEPMDPSVSAEHTKEERSEADAPDQEIIGDACEKEPAGQLSQTDLREDTGKRADPCESAETNIFQETQQSDDGTIQDEPASDDEMIPEQSNTDEEEPAKVVIRRLHTEAPEKKKDKSDTNKGLLYSFLDTLRFICLGLVIGIVLVIFVIQRNDVYGESMAPVLHNGDAVFVEMISTYMKSYEKGDIVTIYATGMEGYDKEEKLIKRVIAGPNDTVTIRDGAVYVNDVLLDEPYLQEGIPTYCNEASKAKGYDNITLKEGEYYVMGDNRGASLDSRIIGPIPVDRIKAHVIVRIFPLNDLKIFQ